MGGENVLDKSAMKTLQDLAAIIPQLATRADLMSVEAAMDKRISLVEAEFRHGIQAVKEKIEEEPLKCPFRDSAGRVINNKAAIDEIEKEQKDQGKAIARLETSMKNIAGLNAVFTAIASAISGFVASLK